MADNFSMGPKLKIDGEAEFKQTIAGINKDMAVLGSEMKKITAEYRDNAGSLDALNAKADIYNRQIDEERKKIDAIKAALASASQEYGENSNQVKEWQIKLNNAKAQLADTENSLKQTKNQMDTFGQGTDQATTETKKLGDSMDQVGQKTLSFGDVLKANLISDAVVAGIRAIGSAISAAFGQLKELAAAALDSADELMKLSDQTGYTAEELQIMKYQGDDLGVSLDTMTGSLSKVTRAMASANDNAEDQYNKSVANAQAVQDLVDKHASYDEILSALSKTTDISTQQQEKYAKQLKAGKITTEDMLDAFQKGIPATSDVAAAFQELGISITDSNGKLRDSKDVMGEAIDALGQVQNETERDALAMKLFGKSAMELNPLIKAGSAGLADLADQAKASGAIMSGDTVTSLDSLGDAMDHLKNSATSAAGTFLAQFAPSLTTVATNIQCLLGGTVTIDQFIASVSQLATEFTAAITTMLPTILTAGGQILTSVINGIVTALPNLIPAAVGVVMQLVDALVANLPAIIDAGLQIIGQLALGIAGALPQLIPAVVSTILTIVDTLISHIDSLVNAGIQILIGLTQGIVKAIPILVQKIPQIIQALMTALSENVPLLIDAGIQCVVMLGRGLIQAIPQLITSIPTIITSIVNGFGSYYARLGEVGLNFVRGLWQGIQDAAGWLRDKVSGFVNDVIDSVKRALGIASPSTVMAGVGGFISMGLAQGITDKAVLVTDAMSRINKDLSAQATINVSSGGREPGIAGVGYATSNLYMDSVLVASGTSKVQFRKNQSRARTFGVLPA